MESKKKIIKMENIISSVLKDSIAEEVEIGEGDRLLSINGSQIKDIIDYRFLAVDDELLLEIEKPDGEVWEIEIEKDYGEDLGIEFKQGLMDNPTSCQNKCIFCFIDQLPGGMRDTLYFKDDDSRLSFLQGNFITLTNMKKEDIDRIIKYRISPINVSVHTTNPELRKKMLNNRFAGNIFETLKELSKADIEINAQIVLCRGINNGDELLRTVMDLYSLYPSVKNVAAVPIGVTKFREGLHNLKTYDRKSAKEEIIFVNKLQERFIKEIKRPFIRLSDEFYVLAEEDVKEEGFYDGYSQLEDGIGMIRCFRENIKRTIGNLRMDAYGDFTIPTGVSAYDEIKKAADTIMKKNHRIKIDVVKVINNFFGDSITVTGLLTGTDVINALKHRGVKNVIMCDTMFRKGYEIGDYEDNLMLDDITAGDVEKSLDAKVLISNYTGENLIDLINDNCEEE